jgi:hypothetical protein
MAHGANAEQKRSAAAAMLASRMAR